MKMAEETFHVNALSLLPRLQFEESSNPSSLEWRLSHTKSTHLRFQKYTSLLHKKQEEGSKRTLVFHLEGALLKSSSLFPYFMLVASEAGSLIRALVLLLLYPLLCLVGEGLKQKIMVFVCFVGLRKDKFRVGASVLPKFFLEDVGWEGFNIVMRCERKVAVTDLPKIMVEGFLKDYLGIEVVVARELKVVCGYYVGLMEEKETEGRVLHELLRGEGKGSHAIGIGCSDKAPRHQLFSHCKETYWVTEADKSNWKTLPRERYPKPLIFHDGRLAFRPTPSATLAMFVWLPIGIYIFIIRYIGGLLLPYDVSNILMAFTGARITMTRPRSSKNKEKKGTLYVCNHKTLLDPVYISYAVMKPLSAVTYSLSRYNEVISPIRTVRLTREKSKDQQVMARELSQGDLVVCPEGTTCREPYLLRFSPLFAEMSDNIVPVAMDVKVPMFYGSTASGFKCLDPLFQFLNPYPAYSIKILEKLPSSYACKDGGKSRIEVANYVQKEIAAALGYQCTSLTRKDKYMILAGNEGIV